MIWKKKFTLENLNKNSKGTMGERIGIHFTHFDDNSISAEMPVNEWTVQPAKILHGGASVALAETLGSVGSFLCIESENETSVGLEINANHMRSVTSGKVTGTAVPLHIGRKTHVWEIKIVNDEKKLVCVSRITIAIIEKK